MQLLVAILFNIKPNVLRIGPCRLHRFWQQSASNRLAKS